MQGFKHMKEPFITATEDTESQRGGGVLIHLTTPTYLIWYSSYSGLFVKAFQIEFTYVNIKMAGPKHK